jgi:pimeloyl-ACP methyl ester carboxylesterase
MNPDLTTNPSRPLRWTLRILRLAFAVALGILVLPVGCQSKFIYFPRPYGPATVMDWQRATAGKTIDYQTSQGRQRSFLQGNLKSPRNLWIVCGGNGTVALDWSEWIELHAPKEDAWLLVDFPGYGDCKGAPSPEGIRENLSTATPLAFKELGWPDHPDPARLRFFGHSLGAAACLIASSEFKIQRGVLIAPFTSTMEMSRVMTGLPMGFLIWHRFDNSARLAELAARGPGEVIILHGAHDESIPVTMSRTLASQRKDVVRLIEIPEGRHNTVQETNTEDVAEAMRECGGDHRSPR